MRQGRPVHAMDIPESPGYTFSPWTSGGISIVNGTFVMPAHDVVPITVPTRNVYMIAFDSNGGNCMHHLHGWWSGHSGHRPVTADNRQWAGPWVLSGFEHNGILQTCDSCSPSNPLHFCFDPNRFAIRSAGFMSQSSNISQVMTRVWRRRSR